MAANAAAQDFLSPAGTYLYAQRDTCDLFMDIYYPSAGSETHIDGKEKPTVIFMFGGGFIGGLIGGLVGLTVISCFGEDIPADLIKSGTATLNMYRIYGIKVTVCGKSGTAQIGGNQIDNALFVCAAPYDRPEIVYRGVVALVAGHVNYLFD